MTFRTAIGIQDFETIRTGNKFYIDKTKFIKDWWETGDAVTLLTRPRRFGKTLNMSMLECFFSLKYQGRSDLFEGLFIWEDEQEDYLYRKLQGTYPVISLSFASVKTGEIEGIKKGIKQVISDVYGNFEYLMESEIFTNREKRYFDSVCDGMDDVTAYVAINRLCRYLEKYHGKKPIVLLDEYDTPMQEAYVCGYWDEMVDFTRSLFNATFKTNPYLERAVMTGITRVSRESIFSDLNNLKVVTTTCDEYATAFGFTEKEVFHAMDVMGMEQKEDVKKWYDGFTFGTVTDIYNPWSIINFLDTGKLGTYWANTSSNGLVGKLLREGNKGMKEQFEQLLKDGVIESCLDEQIVYNQLGKKRDSIWSLLLASGYLKVVDVDIKNEIYHLKLTNYEVKRMFQNMILDWFYTEDDSYNEFIKALLLGDVKAMNIYMNRVSVSMFSSFDTGNKPSEYTEPERFYHGFVLGLIVELKNRYRITSNRESGFGRYDVLLEPLHPQEDDGIILEFKVLDTEDEKEISDTVAAALRQIEEKGYEQILLDAGVKKTRIRKYGFAFEGKKVLIGGK